MVKKIKLLALDIDGVLTDGRTTLGGPNPERKRLAFQDLDAINAAKRAGLTVALVTGESDGSVDLVAARTGVTLIRRGAKDKLAALKCLARKLKISLLEICYVGDGNRDARALAKAGLSFAPVNGTFAAKSAAQIVLAKSGGHGVVAEVVRLLLRKNDERRRVHLLEKGLRHYLGKNWTGSRAGLNRLVSGLAQATLSLIRAVESGHKVILCGDAATVAVDSLFSAKVAWPAVALSSTKPYFLKQIRALARPRDVVIAFGPRPHSPGMARLLREVETRGVESVFFYNLSTSGSPGFTRDWSALCIIASRFLALIETEIA